jgi:hypothetical protein
MTEPVLVPPCHRVYKQGRPMRQSDMGVLTMAQMTVMTMSWLQPHPHPKGCRHGDSWWVGQTAISITSVVIWMAKNRMLHPFISKDLTPYGIHTFYFAAVITVGGGDQSLLPAVLRFLWWWTFTESEMFLFLVTVIWVGHDIHESLSDCWLSGEQLVLPFCGTVARHDIPSHS